MIKNTDVSKDQILKVLPELNVSDLMMIQGAINHLLGGRIGNVSKHGTTLGAAVFDALMAALGGSYPYSAYGPTAKAQLEKRVVHFVAFLDAHFPKWDENKVAQIAFLRMMASLLRDDLAQRGVLPTIGILVTNLQRMPEVFDNAYPGYIAAGLGSAVLNQIKRKVT